jgi:hypothetical protein
LVTTLMVCESIEAYIARNIILISTYLSFYLLCRP